MKYNKKRKKKYLTPFWDCNGAFFRPKNKKKIKLLYFFNYKSKTGTRAKHNKTPRTDITTKKNFSEKLRNVILNNAKSER